MALPAGVSTATLTVGVPVNFSGAPLKSYISIKPSVSLVHTATGTPLVNLIDRLETTEGAAGQYALPHTDQDGFQDENGNAYKNWYYTATIQYAGTRETMPETSKTFQLLVGQTTVDLDLLPSGVPAMPWTAPVSTVTDVNGQTGSVTLVEATDAALEAIVSDPESSTSTALSVAYASSAKVRGLAPSPLSGVVVTTLGIAPRPFDYINGVLYGADGVNLKKSTDGGRTWAAAGILPTGFAIRMVPAPAGEVIFLTDKFIYKSAGFASGSPTWTLKATAYGATQFQGWSIDGDGTRYITTEYAAGVSFPDSRYVRMTLDGGNTWNIVYDSVAKHGQVAADGSHLHGCAYDKWSNRWYVSEGHSNTGDIGGIYVSEDNGVTWSRAEGMKANPAPTVIIATDDGLVCASDNADGGVYGVVRTADPALQSLRRVWAWRPGISGVNGFGVHGHRDPETGIVYIGYRTEKATLAPFLVGGTPTTGARVYTWSGAFAAYDDIRQVWALGEGEILATVALSQVFSTVRGYVSAPTIPHTTVLDTGGVIGGTTSSGDSVASGPLSNTGTSIRSVAVGVGASTVGSAQDSVAVGQAALSAGASSVAVGAQASTPFPNSVAVGQGANVAGNASVAIGQGATATGGGVAIGATRSAPTSSVVIGTTASVIIGSLATSVGYGAGTRNNGTALGANATNTGNDGTAVGASASANSNAVAVGKSATTADSSVAVGSTAAASVQSTTAIGFNATAAHARSVALGHTSATTQTDQVAVGDRDIEVQSPTRGLILKSPNGTRFRVSVDDDGALTTTSL